MNILQVQDDLKNFSQQQLVQEMKQPKGVAPQFLVLGEITRRKRMSDDMKTRGAADQKTVAQDVVSAAGVPQGGLAQMAQAMAPKSSIEPNMQPQGQAQPQAPMPMASGGILSLAGGGRPTAGEAGTNKDGKIKSDIGVSALLNIENNSKNSDDYAKALKEHASRFGTIPLWNEHLSLPADGDSAQKYKVAWNRLESTPGEPSEAPIPKTFENLPQMSYRALRLANYAS